MIKKKHAHTANQKGYIAETPWAFICIHMRHWAFKREKYTFINANIKGINTILKAKRDN